jgi:mevalonate kinase
MRDNKKLKNMIIEQLNPEQLSKLERFLRSNNEEDFRQGLQIASTLLDSGGYEDYPQLSKLYNDIAAEKDAKIQSKIKSIRKIKKEQAQVAGDVAKLTKEIQNFEKEMRELGYDEGSDQLTSIALQAAGFHSLKNIRKEMRKDLRYLKNKNRDLLNYIDIAESDLERLLADYRTFGEFPITMRGGSFEDGKFIDRGSVVVQDPMMEHKSKKILRISKKDLKKIIEHLSKN